MEQKLKLAILDLYDGEPNQGMRAIREIIHEFENHMDYQVFDVRGKAEVPSLDFDLFISTGGPGNPLEYDGKWDLVYFKWLQDLWEWNKSRPEQPKYLLLICHSFQMACHHFQVAKVIRRKSKSFGTFRCHKTAAGKREPYFSKLPNPFWVADFRDYQVIQPDMDRFNELGAEIVALEKIRPHVPLERAVMAIRFSKEIFGVQFHPEADPEGMIAHFTKPENQEMIHEKHGEAKYQRMIDHLNDPDKIPLTHNAVIPSFLQDAIDAAKKVMA